METSPGQPQVCDCHHVCNARLPKATTGAHMVWQMRLELKLFPGSEAGAWIADHKRGYLLRGVPKPREAGHGKYFP